MAQMARPQNHRVEIALVRQGALKALAQLVGREGEGRTLVHGLTGQNPGAG